MTQLIKSPLQREVADKDLSIIIKNGERKIVQKDLLIYIPFFRDDDTCLMIQKNGVVKFLEVCDWNLVFDTNKTTEYLEKLEIKLLQATEIVASPILERNEDSTAMVQVQILNLGWGEFRTLLAPKEGFNYIRVKLTELPLVNTVSLSTKWAQEWAYRTLLEKF